jgi:D-aspartate ligase
MRSEPAASDRTDPAQVTPVSHGRAGQVGAIVINGHYSGLGIVRSLGRRGIPVWFLKGHNPLAVASRYARRRLPWPEENEVRQRDYLLSLGERYRLDEWVLFPSGDAQAALIARHHDALQGRFRLTTPPWDVFRLAYDKRLTYRLAEDLGVDYPWTRYPSGPEEVAALDCPFPVILKPAHKDRENALTASKAWRVDDRQSLIARYVEACTMIEPDVIMVQELIPGGGESQVSYAALCSEGRPLAWLMARGARQFPADFGLGSTCVETIDQPELEVPARRILAAMGFSGLVEIEFKRDPRTGRFKLLDINARVWGWHTLGRRAGVDFPYLLWRLAHGAPVPEVRGRPGVRWIHMVPDIQTAIHEIRRGSLSVRAYLQSLTGPMEWAVFALDDPLPALIEVPLMYRLRRKRGRA